MSREKTPHERLAAIIATLAARSPDAFENWLLDGEDRVERMKAKRRRAP